MLVRGSFNTWDAKDWAFLILSIVLLGSGIFFFSSPDLKDIALYPLLGSIPFVIIVTIRTLFRGNFHLTRQTLIWKMNVGPMKSRSVHQIEVAELETTSSETILLLKDNKGKKIRKFKECKTPQAAGAVVLYLRYLNVLPELVFNEWKPISKGKRTYERAKRHISLSGKSILEDVGSMVLFENKLLFIPTSVEQVPPTNSQSLIRQAELLSGKTVYPPNEFVLTHTIIEAILEVNMPTAIRDGYIQRVVEDNGGCILFDPKRNGKIWEWTSPINGIKVQIERP